MDGGGEDIKINSVREDDAEDEVRWKQMIGCGPARRERDYKEAEEQEAKRVAANLMFISINVFIYRCILHIYIYLYMYICVCMCPCIGACIYIYMQNEDMY